MKSINYYIREGKHPVTAVTVYKQDELISRGVAVCNKCDQFIKSVGRDLSKLRAAKAISKEKSFGKIRQNILVDKLHKYKCEFMPELTDYEIELLTEPVKK